MSLSKVIGKLFRKEEAYKMPPANAIATTVAISDDDSSDVDAHLPVASWRENVEDEGNGDASSPPASARPKRTAAPKKEEPEQVEDDEDEDEDGDEDLEDDVFIVEAIKKHMIDEDGTLKFHVKWEGYESKKDMTWEPEDNLLESASEVLDEYFAQIGGRDNIYKQTETAARGKKRGRPASNGTAAAAPTKRSRKNATHPAETTPPATAKKWSPPAGSWEDHIENIDASRDEGTGRLMVYLVWKNGQKTKHDTSVIYKKCPQKMLQYYERHVKIIQEEPKAVESIE
ncbi:hypothetical protein K4F52_006927 [Lecanicillium sp. MT-2017a]|nr:hypothetical protein K4F52_006927 [Lecanicillium sp. MT-2017a]